MSESFEPEKVERADMCDFDDPRGLFVRASDYDTLLELYREAVNEFARFGHGDSYGLKHPAPPEPRNADICDVYRANLALKDKEASL